MWSDFFIFSRKKTISLEMRGDNLVHFSKIIVDFVKQKFFWSVFAGILARRVKILQRLRNAHFKNKQC